MLETRDSRRRWSSIGTSFVYDGTTKPNAQVVAEKRFNNQRVTFTSETQNIGSKLSHLHTYRYSHRMYILSSSPRNGFYQRTTTIAYGRGETLLPPARFLRAFGIVRLDRRTLAYWSCVRHQNWEVICANAAAQQAN